MEEALSREDPNKERIPPGITPGIKLRSEIRLNINNKSKSQSNSIPQGTIGKEQEQQKQEGRVHRITTKDPKKDLAAPEVVHDEGRDPKKDQLHEGFDKDITSNLTLTTLGTDMQEKEEMNREGEGEQEIRGPKDRVKNNDQILKEMMVQSRRAYQKLKEADKHTVKHRTSSNLPCRLKNWKTACTKKIKKIPEKTTNNKKKTSQVQSGTQDIRKFGEESPAQEEQIPDPEW